MLFLPYVQPLYRRKPLKLRQYSKTARIYGESKGKGLAFYIQACRRVRLRVDAHLLPRLHKALRREPQDLSFKKLSENANRKPKGLSQKLLIKRKTQPFAMQFCTFRQNKRKKPQIEAKKSMTKRGSAKSSILRVIQFRGEFV